MIKANKPLLPQPNNYFPLLPDKKFKTNEMFNIKEEILSPSVNLPTYHKYLWENLKHDFNV